MNYFLLEMALIACAIALLPLLWIIFFTKKNRYQKLLWIITFLIFDLIIVGVFTRLSDSGLGCPDWPGCYQQAHPINASQEIIAAQTALPTGPVTVFKAWVEMIHRYMAMVVGILSIVIMVLALRRYVISRNKAELWPCLLFVLICLQGAFGAWTVTLKLQPIIVTTHLLLALAILQLSDALALRQSGLQPIQEIFHLRPWIILGSILLIVQIALGAWVSSNYAVLACTDFPKCQGYWLPEMDFKNAFYPWRALGQTASGENLSLAGLTAIHWLHRNFALLVFGLLTWLAYRLLSVKETGVRRLSLLLFILLAAQLLTGLANIFFDWPLVNALLHSVGAALLVLVLGRLRLLASDFVKAIHQNSFF